MELTSDTPSAASGSASFHTPQTPPPRPQPALRDLYTGIGGVSRLSESGVVSKFVLPEFGVMDAAQQASMLAHVKAQWETLKADAPLVAALKEVAFG